MCRTSAPPRRDMYELQEELAADKGGFLLPAHRRIRVGTGNDHRRAQIYNAEYLADGTRYTRFDRPWTAFTAIDFRTFTTHAEALQWVLQEARK